MDTRRYPPAQQRPETACAARNSVSHYRVRYKNRRALLEMLDGAFGKGR
ncbi:MAG: hypothetical protein LBR93_04665 [Treponema sp.]|nr:hypothetical protein [Treponema sp.]